jgi:hypothetical protein
LGGAVRQPLKGVEPVGGGDVADGVHPRVDVERRQALRAAVDFSDATADLARDTLVVLRRYGRSPLLEESSRT